MKWLLYPLMFAGLVLAGVFPLAASAMNAIPVTGYQATALVDSSASSAAVPDDAKPAVRKAAAAAPPPASAPAINSTDTTQAVRTALVLGLLALIPALVICMTPFLRIVVVLSMLRHAFGMPETPPNQVLVSLALFLTMLIMSPVLGKVNTDGLQPFLNGTASMQESLDHGSQPLRTFMLRQVHDQDIKAVYDMSRQPLPRKAADVGTMQLASAFMLNELRVSFKIGFVILLPFVLIDLVVSSILLSLGMMMVPPSTLSLPLKVLMFVMIDGWSLVLEGVVGSFR
ncbi:flagellar type III secretion system pore protein FliP [Asticcacaulis solisilvae]|uniref:flagellar type III secretion system pore protein FliP n=1 Tax=Asticcacaulis solisilvae TaxID=1217274 RepID=UPI003FD6C8D2